MKTLSLSLCLAAGCLSTAAGAAPAKPTVKKAVKKGALKPLSSVKGAQSLGNGIFILGEGTTPAQIDAALKMTRPASTPAPVATAPKRQQTGAQLVRFCRSYLGRKLGNGQCTELAMLGLPASGAQLYPDYQWGNLVCVYGVSNGQQTIAVTPLGRFAKNPSRADIRPGDIIQYEGVAFERHWDNGYSRHEYPHHTAVVEGVSRDGRTLNMLEQNVNGTQYVLQSTLYLPDMTSGTMKIMRPVPHG